MGCWEGKSIKRSILNYHICGRHAHVIRFVCGRITLALWFWCLKNPFSLLVPVTTTSDCQTLNAMVGIVMVGSRSVGQENFRKQKDFVKRVAASYGLSSTGTQAGIIAYSNSAQVYAKMGEHTDQNSFEQAVDRVVYTRGTSRIDKALRLASLRFFPTNGMLVMCMLYRSKCICFIQLFT